MDPEDREHLAELDRQMVTATLTDVDRAMFEHVLRRPEVAEALEQARAAMDGDSNDDEHDALVMLVSVLTPFDE